MPSASPDDPTASVPPRIDATSEALPEPPAAPGFLIVGIGCSAGGLEALEEFFHAASPHGGAAFVVVQHLAPDHPSALPEILQRFTPMHVVEAQQSMPVQPDCVYVIPPNRSLSIADGMLQLHDTTSQRGLRLPIDAFLQSLAGYARERAIGVLLSGMGSDGVQGLKAIRQMGGLTLVQQPESAHADHMPRAAIAAGAADIVALPEQMPARIARHFDPAAPASVPVTPVREDPLAAIIKLLSDRTGNDFSLYKMSTLGRRVERRMALHQIGTTEGYLAYLRQNAQEFELLFKELLIGVTSFFRDAPVWDALRNQHFGAVFAQYPVGKALRAWVPACSTGEEAYSLAIAFRAALENHRPGGHFSLQIYATDLDTDAVDKARRGIFPRTIANDVAPEILAHYFVEDASGGYRVCNEIRQMVVFAPQNVISDPPFTRLDILSCRNLLIYFQPQLQKKLLPLFHYALIRGGLLLLGSSESVGEFGHLFATEDSAIRLYRSLAQPRRISALALPAPADRSPSADSAARAEPEDAIGRLTDQLIQQNHSPAAVLVNAQGDILYISGRTGKYLEPAAGKVNMNLHAMAREGLREALTGMVHKALSDGRPIQLHGLRVGTNGTAQTVDVSVNPLDTPEPLRGRVLVVFRDVATPGGASKK